MSRTASRARSDDGTARPLGWRVTFATVLALAMGSGTLLGYAFGVLGPALVAEFSLSQTQLGLLTSVFFLVGRCSYWRQARRWTALGRRRVMLAAFALMGVSLAAMVASPDYVSLFGISAVAGLALSTGNPTTNKAVAEQIPPGAGHGPARRAEARPRHRCSRARCSSARPWTLWATALPGSWCSPSWALPPS